MSRKWPVFILLLLAGGCVTAPFDPVALAPLGDTTADEMRQAVDETTPQRFTLLQSVVFEYRRRSMTAVCVVKIDVPARAFHIAAMSPAGMKLFEISGSNGEIKKSFVAPGLDEWGDPVKAIAGDIQRVYLAPVPVKGARTQRLRGRMLFVDTQTHKTIMEHVLGGEPPVLLGVSGRDRRGIVWSAAYYDFLEHNGKMYAGGIVYTNRRYGYRLILRLKDVLNDAMETPREGKDK